MESGIRTGVSHGPVDKKEEERLKIRESVQTQVALELAQLRQTIEQLSVDIAKPEQAQVVSGGDE